MATEEVISMLLMLLVAVTLVAAYVWIFVWSFNESPERPREASRSKPGTGRRASSAPPVTQPESLEGVLVGQLGSGEITRGQYVLAMEHLAARDAERHPLAVPPDAAPPQASSGT
jgi:hypothetical protein